MFLSYATVRSTFAGAKVQQIFDIRKKKGKNICSIQKNVKIFGHVKKSLYLCTQIVQYHTQ